ncbi:hypothetical protein H1C71_017527, partial [Ictidomys tridecemlineatus]
SRSARLQPRSLGPGGSLGFLCAPGPLVTIREPVPPTQARVRSPVTSATYISLPPGCRDCSKTGQHEGQKVERRAPFVSRSQLANSPSPAPTLAIPTATFSLPSRFPLGCGERTRGRE